MADLKTVRSTKDSREHLTAHIDCSAGINDTTFLAACLDALEIGDAGEFLEGLRSSILSDDGSGPMKPTSSKRFSRAVDPPPATVEPSGKNECTDLYLISVFLDALKKEIDASESPKLIRWEVLPEWVTNTTKSIFSEVFEAHSNLKEEHAECDERSKGTSDVKSSNQRISLVEESAYSCLFNVIATLVCLDKLGILQFSCSPLPMMRSIFEPSMIITGFFERLQRGMVITPAVTKTFEATTPLVSVLSTAVGLAMLRVLTGTSKSQKKHTAPMILHKCGYGIDANDPTLRVSIILGRTEGSDAGNEFGIANLGSDVPENRLFCYDRVALMETNLDDISGEHLAFAIELLLEHGAIDAWATPIVMKKGRPAHTLHCLCKDNNGTTHGGNENTTLDTLLELIFVHTSTLGIRIRRGIPRAKLDRSICTVSTGFENSSRKGMVDVKVSRFTDGRVVRKKAEFDHCKQIAMETGAAIKVVSDQAIRVYDNESENR